MKYVLIIVLIAQFIFTGCASEQRKGTNISNQVEEEKNTNQIDFKNAFFVDVRTPGEFESGSFAGAINIPLNQLKARISEIPRSSQVIVFCKSGARASQAQQILKEEGYKNVRNGVNTSQLKSLQKQ